MVDNIKIFYSQNGEVIQQIFTTLIIAVFVAVLLSPSDAELVVKYDSIFAVVVCIIYLLTNFFKNQYSLLVTLGISSLFSLYYFYFIDDQLLSTIKIFGYVIFLRAVYEFLGCKLFRENLAKLFWVLVFINPVIQIYQLLMFDNYRQRGIVEEPAHLIIWIIAILFLFFMIEKRSSRQLLSFCGSVLVISILSSSVAVFAVAILSILAAIFISEKISMKNKIKLVFSSLILFSAPFFEGLVGSTFLATSLGLDSFHNINHRMWNILNDGSAKSRILGSLNFLIAIYQSSNWGGIGISNYSQFLNEQVNKIFIVYDTAQALVPEVKIHIFHITGIVLFGFCYLIFLFYIFYKSLKSWVHFWIFCIWLVFGCGYGGLLSPAILSLHSAMLFLLQSNFTRNRETN